MFSRGFPGCHLRCLGNVEVSPGPACVGVLNTVHAAPRIMYMRAFASLFAGRPSGLHVRNIILAAPRFNALLEELNATIAEDFSAAREYVRVFEAVRMIHDHQLAWDKAAYESEVGFDARRVRLDLRKFRGWKAELDRMKVSQVCGTATGAPAGAHTRSRQYPDSTLCMPMASPEAAPGCTEG